MATRDRRVVLGVDPGTAILGYGVVAVEGDELSAIEYGVLNTSSNLPLSARLLSLFEGLSSILERTSPSEVAVEQLFFARNVQSAFAVGQARGVVLLAAARASIPVSEYTPLQVKQAVAGYGRATKEQVQQMVQVMLRLPEIPHPDDAADALAIALCHAQWTEAMSGRSSV